MEKIKENFSLPSGRQIRGARALLGFTQESCAKAAGVSLSSYKRYEGISDSETLLLLLKYGTIMSIVEYFYSCGIEFGNSAQAIFVSFDPTKFTNK